MYCFVLKRTGGGWFWFVLVFGFASHCGLVAVSEKSWYMTTTKRGSFNLKLLMKDLVPRYDV